MALPRGYRIDEGDDGVHRLIRVKDDAYIGDLEAGDPSAREELAKSLIKLDKSIAAADA